jgi:hypothetical protein
MTLRPSMTLRHQVAAGTLLGLTEDLVARAYRPDGIAFVPFSGLAPATRAVGWCRNDTRDDVLAVVKTICDVADMDQSRWANSTNGWR